MCETIKEFIGKMATLQQITDETNSGAGGTGGGGDESINQKCRVLNEKLDQLLGTLHEEASPVHAATPRVSLEEDEMQQDVAIDPNTIVTSVRISFFF